MGRWAERELDAQMSYLERDSISMFDPKLAKTTRKKGDTGMSSIGEVIQGTGDEGNQQQAAKQEVVVDPHDPQLVSEVISVDITQDAYADPPPPPDAIYRGKIKLQQVDVNGTKKDYVEKAWGKNSTKTYVTGVEVTLLPSVLDPSGKYEGLKVFDSQVSTFIRNGTHKVATIISRLTKPDGTPWVTKEQAMAMTPQQWIQLFVKAIAGEPEIGVETQWEWSCAGCREEGKKTGVFPRSMKGMRNMPHDEELSKPGAPVYNPEKQCDADPAHGPSRARLTIDRFLSIKELQKYEASRR